MPEATGYLDCCEKPVLQTVKSFLSAETELVAIRRCQKCGCHWFYRLREYLREYDRTPDDRETDEYDRRIWYVRLTPEEAEALMKTAAVPDPSLFADRPGFLRDADGMNKIHGIPYFLQ